MTFHVTYFLKIRMVKKLVVLRLLKVVVLKLVVQRHYVAGVCLHTNETVNR